MPDTTLTPSAAPASAPKLFLPAPASRVITLRLMDRDSTRRGRPRGVIGAMVFTFVGVQPPHDIKDWGAGTLTTKPKLNFTVDASVPAGAQVWVTACWLGPRLQRGPCPAPVSFRVPFGGVVGTGGLRIAA